MHIYKFIMNAKNYLKIRYLKKKKQQQQQQKLTHYEVWPASCMVAYLWPHPPSDKGKTERWSVYERLIYAIYANSCTFREGGRPVSVNKRYKG